jgi:integrase
MATLVVKQGSTPGYMIQWYNGSKRHTLYLGGKRYNHKTAERLKEVIEILVYCRYNSLVVLDKSTTAWIQEAHESIKQKLEKTGLITFPSKRTCQKMWDTFYEFKTDVKEGTLAIYKDCQNKFLTVFDKDEPIEALTHQRLLEWKKELLTKYAPASVASHLKSLKTVLNWAVKQKWLDRSPAEGISLGSFVNKSNDRIISMEAYEQLLESCPDHRWRMIIALARIGGIRCPSELALLKWGDVDFDKQRLYITSPKTERHEGKEGRTIPLFPQLRQELEKAELRTGNVIDVVPSSLYQDFQKIAKDAGLGSIIRPFDNMRMSRSNEVLAKWGPLKESLWIGHSQKVMKKHYLVLADADYLSAAQ